MAWVVLVVSALFEAVWATALSRITGWTSTGPILAFGLGAVVSMTGLAWAMREIPVGTAYAVWVGIGAAATVGYAWASGAQVYSTVHALLILGIVACVAGLKLTH
jgi:quaternary ammonium compound-resistance protein SugE